MIILRNLLINLRFIIMKDFQKNQVNFLKEIDNFNPIKAMMSILK